MAARFVLGIGESSNFPAAIKTVADWFPRQERALATGIFNSGSNVGAIAAPLLVPFIAARLGWRPVFLATGALDLVWLAAWLYFYRRPSEHKKLSASERAYIQAGQPLEAAARVPYARLIGTHQAWAFILGKVHHRPGLVVLSVLDSRLSQSDLWAGSDAARAALDCHLLVGGLRFDRRRLAGG